MQEFVLKLSPAAVRDLDQMDEALAGRILAALPVLRENPFPKDKLIKKIKGKQTNYYRLRIDKYRAYYSIEDSEVLVLRV